MTPLPHRRTLMRFTVVDARGTVSFLAPPHALKALAAGCSRGATDTRELLTLLRDYDPDLSDGLVADFHRFDEHNTATTYEAFRRGVGEADPAAWPPFRVFDERTRQASLQPVDRGLVLFNLVTRRIVQVQNQYRNLERRDRGRIRSEGRPTRQLYRYELPQEWRIVP